MFDFWLGKGPGIFFEPFFLPLVLIGSCEARSDGGRLDLVSHGRFTTTATAVSRLVVPLVDEKYG